MRVPAGRPTAAALFDEEERDGANQDDAFKMVRTFEVSKLYQRYFPASEASREVANLTERKNHVPMFANP